MGERVIEQVNCLAMLPAQKQKDYLFRNDEKLAEAVAKAEWHYGLSHGEAAAAPVMVFN